MGAAALPLLVGGGAALQAVGSIQQGNAAYASARSQAAAELYNAQANELRAQQALARSGQEEQAQRRGARMQLGAARGAALESGVGVEGSAGLVYQQSVANAELDALNIRYGGVLESQGYKEEAKMNRISAANAIRAGKQARTAGYIGAGTAVLQAGASYYGMKK